MQIALTRKSSNAKTGPIPVSVTSRHSCPDSCPLKASKTCYAEWGPLSIHWTKITSGERGGGIDEFCKDVKALPEKQLWRHNQAGDLPGDNMEINQADLKKIVNANEGKKGFTYTHKPVLAEHGAAAHITFKNKKAIEDANKNGFTVNLSADDIDEADKMVDLGIAPVVTIVPSDKTEDFRTPKGRLVKICPAIVDETQSCAKCKICQKHKRKFIVAFPAHGTKKKALNEMLKEAS